MMTVRSPLSPPTPRTPRRAAVTRADSVSVEMMRLATQRHNIANVEKLWADDHTRRFSALIDHSRKRSTGGDEGEAKASFESPHSPPAHSRNPSEASLPVINSSTKPSSGVKGAAAAAGDDDDDRGEVAFSGGADVISVLSLSKVYQREDASRHRAVSRLTFGVPAGQCFALLGPNGSGKTTTLKILTGDLAPTSGEAYLSGYSIGSGFTHSQIYRTLGQCPQFDALFPHLSGREHLFLFAAIKGVPRYRRGEYTQFYLDQVLLGEHADDVAGSYSGGNKRKLSLAIALMGNPRVVVLDEPSSGMDPAARRALWALIRAESARPERATIITTHSMAEAEALSDRIGIVVNGELRALGASQHLKSVYARGYQLELRTRDDPKSVARLRAFIDSAFSGAQLMEELAGRVVYRTRALRLGEAFSILEANRTQIALKDYSISQATLEQVFLALAKAQGTDSDRLQPH